MQSANAAKAQQKLSQAAKKYAGEVKNTYKQKASTAKAEVTSKVKETAGKSYEVTIRGGKPTPKPPNMSPLLQEYVRIMDS